MGKSILDFTSINGRSGTEFTQVKGRSGTVFWCKPYILTLSSKPTGVDTITCYRYSSLQPGAATGPSAVLANGSTIYHGDVIYISATASSGYKAPSISSSTGTISSNMLPVDGNESITVTAGELDVAPVYITAGTGVSSVFLSTNINATSGSASGSNFNIGDTVYGFAVLQTGYNPGSDWEPVSGSIYRVGSIPVAISGNDFGTINSAGRKSYTVTWKWYSSNTPFATENTATETYYYGDTPSRSNPGNVEDDPYSRTFTGWDNLSPITSNRTIWAQYSTTEKLYDVILTRQSGLPADLDYGWTRGTPAAGSGTRTIKAPYYAKVWCSGATGGYNIDFYVGTEVGKMEYGWNTAKYTWDPYVNATYISYHHVYQGIRYSNGQLVSDGAIVGKGFSVVPWFVTSNKPYAVKIVFTFTSGISSYSPGGYFSVGGESVSGRSFKGFRWSLQGYKNSAYQSIDPPAYEDKVRSSAGSDSWGLVYTSDLTTYSSGNRIYLLVHDYSGNLIVRLGPITMTYANVGKSLNTTRYSMVSGYDWWT